MIPILYSSDSTEFAYRSTHSDYILSNGLGALYDCIDCKVAEELNGEYELAMTYPINGQHFSDIGYRSIIAAKPYDGATKLQPFRVYSIKTRIDGRAEIYARHLTYDLSNYVVSPTGNAALTASNSTAAFALLKNDTYVYPTGCPFTISSRDRSAVEATFTISAPSSVRSLLGGVTGSLLDIYTGQYSYDDCNVYLDKRRGADRGVSVVYGKNLTDYEQDRNCENVYTGIYPYWKSENDDGSFTLVTVDGKVVNCSGTFDYTKILPVDFSDSFSGGTPTSDQLKEVANTYISENDIGVPDVSWTINFVQLAKSKEYSTYSLLEHVELGDTVNVYFDKLDVEASATVVSYEYDVLKERYEDVQLGKVKSSLSERIAISEKEVEEKPSVSMTEEISRRLASMATGKAGGMVRMLDTDGDGYPDTLTISDNPDPALAHNLWEFSSAGWRASSDNGSTWTVGASLSQGILANFITAAHLTSGTISSSDWNGSSGTYHLDLSSGDLIMAGFSYDASSNSVTIGTTDNQIRLIFDNDEIRFVDPNNTEIATFDSLGIHISGVNANANIGLGDWRITHKKGFGLRYVG